MFVLLFMQYLLRASCQGVVASYVVVLPQDFATTCNLFMIVCFCFGFCSGGVKVAACTLATQLCNSCVFVCGLCVCVCACVRACVCGNLRVQCVLYLFM